MSIVASQLLARVGNSNVTTVTDTAPVANAVSDIRLWFDGLDEDQLKKYGRLPPPSELLAIPQDDRSVTTPGCFWSKEIRPDSVPKGRTMTHSQNARALMLAGL